MEAPPELADLVVKLRRHDSLMRSSFSFIPSENILSPAARLAYLSDAYQRYFFGEKRLGAQWQFQGGSLAGEIQDKILLPHILQLARARHVDVRSVSGLGGMLLGLLAFGGTGSRVMTVPVRMGGHPVTQKVARRLGLKPEELPAADWHEVDWEALGDRLSADPPELIYVDQATALFPIDVRRLVEVARSAPSRRVHVHVDTSHINGLVWGGQLPNPLECGADSYGGSTHKTFPGPHKAVLFTNDEDVAARITGTATKIVSHHHLADVVALAITVLEFQHRGGQEYARQVVMNAEAFARTLQEAGIPVVGAASGYTCTHQIWADVSTLGDAFALGERTFEVGLVLNPYDPLPCIDGMGLRFGLNEPTRLGLREDDVRTLARFVARALRRDGDRACLEREVRALRRCFAPAYCYDRGAFDAAMRLLLEAFDTRGEGLSAMLYR